METAVTIERRNMNYYVPKEKLCMNCGQKVTNKGNSFYERRFCSVECKLEYCEILSELKKI